MHYTARPAMRQNHMATGSNNAKSEQFVIRVPHDVAARIRTTAESDHTSTAKTIVGALRQFWDIPETVKKKETGQ